MPYYPERKPEPPEETPIDRKGVRGRERGKRILRTMVAAFSALMIVYGGFRLIQYGIEYFASRRTSRELQRFATATDVPAEPHEITLETMVMPEETETPTPVVETAGTAETETAKNIPETLRAGEYPDNPQLMISEKFLQLRKKSKNIVGWLSMDEVEEAVAQKDNTYFLTHDALGNKNSNGAIFLDAEINLYKRPYTYILYGHNMKSGNMFGRLRKYKESSYYFKHQIITFDTMYETGKFAVFAVAEIGVSPGAVNWFDIWSLASESSSTREAAIRELEKRSVHGPLLEVAADEQILLLVTCVDSDTERLVVAARRLREGETESHLTYRQN